MFSIIASELTFEIFLGALSIFIAWFIYRKQLIDERKRILNSVNALLEMSGEWFRSTYNKNSESQNWYSPNFSVYPVDVSQVPNILTSNLLSIEISRHLSFFIQLVRRFNHRIDLLNNFLHSDPKLFKEACLFYKNEYKNLTFREVDDRVKEQNDELKFYLEHLYLMQKQIHTDGIAEGQYNNSIPSLSLCFQKIECLFQIENKKQDGFLRGRFILVIGDIFFLLLPAAIVTIFVLNFYKNHITLH